MVERKGWPIQTIVVTPAKVKAFLDTPAIYQSIVDEKEERYRSLQEQATKTTTTLSVTPAGGGQDRNAMLAALADADRDFAIWQHRLWEMDARVEDFLTSAIMTTPLRKCLLYQRYRKRLKWDQVLLVLAELRKEEGKEPISKRKMFYEHLKALEDCSDWVNLSGKFLGDIIFDDKI